MLQSFGIVVQSLFEQRYYRCLDGVFHGFHAVCRLVLQLKNSLNAFINLIGPAEPWIWLLCIWSLSQEFEC